MNILLKFCINRQSRYYEMKIILFLILTLLILFPITLGVGATPLPIKQIVTWLLGGDVSKEVANIMLYIRLPRSIASILCGAALAVSGVLLQANLGNSLASPGIIGVNAGAGLFSLLSAIIFPYQNITRILAIFIGALIAPCLVCILSGRGASRLLIIISGVAISSVFSATIDAIITFVPDVVADRVSFNIGGFSAANLESLLYATPYILLGLLGAMIISPQLNVILLGDEIAFSLGVSVKLCRWVSIFCAAILSAGAVSICGLLGFVGLIVPNTLRYYIKDIRYLIPAAALAGGILVSISDMLSRFLFAPYEFPVGIILSFFCAPYFLYLILSKKGKIND